MFSIPCAPFSESLLTFDAAARSVGRSSGVRTGCTGISEKQYHIFAGVTRHCRCFFARPGPRADTRRPRIRGAILSDETRRRLLTESDASPREARASSRKERSRWPCRISSCSMSMSLEKSAAFYARLLGRQPLDSSPNFVMFELAPGLRLGLWARRDVKPAPRGASDAGELAMAVGSNEEVEALCADHKRKGATILQEPVPWTSAGPSSPRTRTDTGCGCSALRLGLRRPRPRSLQWRIRRRNRFSLASACPEPIDRDMLGGLAVFRDQDAGASLVSLGRRHTAHRRASDLLPRSGIRTVGRPRRIAERGECRRAWRAARCGPRRQRCRKFQDAARPRAPD